MPLSEEDKKEVAALITEQIGPTVNNMFTARLGTVEKKLTGQLKELTDTISKSVDEKLSTLKPVVEDPDDKGGKNKGGKGENVELATLRKQQLETTKLLEDMKRERDQERSKRRDVALRQATSEQLAKIGIDGTRFKGAFAMLQQDGRIKHRDDDSDELVFVDDAGSEVELEVGLAAWAKTDEAKIFLPPSGMKGAGTRPSGGNNPPPKLSPEQQQEAAWTAAGEAIRGAFSGPNGSL